MHESRGFKVARWMVLTLLALFVLVPLYVMITTSLKPLPDVQGEFTWWPSTISFEAYREMWKTVPLAEYMKNSIIVSSVATLLSVVVAVFAAYAVSRARFRGRGTFMSAILSTQMFPGILFLLPLYLIFVQVARVTGVDLVGSYLGLIITYLTFCLPFSIWMLAAYFEGIPRELDEAAAIDGAGVLRTLVRVILPTAMPGIVAVAVFSFMVAWGEVLFASVLTTDETRTIAIGIQNYATDAGVYWNQVMAASLVVSIPVVVGFLLLQRFLVAGVTTGSVK